MAFKELCQRTLDLMRRYWWGPAASYLAWLCFFYGLIWSLIDPMGLPEHLAGVGIPNVRWYVHFFASMFLAGHITIAQELIGRKFLFKRRPFSRLYRVALAAPFYDLISDRYESRNSTALRETHAEVVRALASLPVKPKRVLDLGGGTGCVAARFSNDPDMEWHCVDSSVGMLAKFQDNLNSERGDRLKAHTHKEDIHVFLDRANLAGEQFDVAIFSLVLSSMAKSPDWLRVCNLLSPGGRLIIADIDHKYTSEHPHYAVDLGEAGVLALETRAVSIDECVREFNGRFDLDAARSRTVMEATYPYAAIHCFIKR